LSCLAWYEIASEQIVGNWELDFWFARYTDKWNGYSSLLVEGLGLLR
jgi:hypothetical protein